MNSTGTSSPMHNGLRALQIGLTLGRQWRLLLSWMLVICAVWLLALLPLWSALASQLNRSVLSDRLLAQFDVAVFAEALSGIGHAGYSPGAHLGAALVLLVLLPWLSGLLQSAARVHVGRSTLGGLWLGGWREYATMARLWLLQALLLGAVLAAGGGIHHAIEQQAEEQLLATDSDWMRHALLATSAMLLLLIQVSMDATRAQLVAEPQRRSVFKAWAAACVGLWRRPSRIVLCLALSLLGALIAAALGWLRLQLLPVSTAGVLGSLLLSLALCTALVWTRCARVFALVWLDRQGP